MIEIATSTIDDKVCKSKQKIAKMMEMKFENKKIKEADLMENKRRIAVLESRKYQRYIDSFDRITQKYNYKKNLEKQFLTLKAKADMLTIQKHQQLFQNMRLSNPNVSTTKGVDAIVKKSNSPVP